MTTESNQLTPAELELYEQAQMLIDGEYLWDNEAVIPAEDYSWVPSDKLGAQIFDWATTILGAACGVCMILLVAKWLWPSLF